MKFKVGQPVECLLFGKGIIEAIDNNYDCTIMVRFGNEDAHYYTKEGKYHADGRATLTPGTWKVEEILPEPKFEKGQPVWVKNLEQEEWRLRYYHMYTNNQHYAFFDNKIENTESSYPWNYIKPFEGIDPNN